MDFIGAIGNIIDQYRANEIDAERFVSWIIALYDDEVAEVKDSN